MKPYLNWQRITQITPSILFIAPLFFFWIYSIWINPSNNYYVNDAEFPYFVNSLAVFKGGTYRYVDHPGTPVEVLGSGILALTYPFLSSAPNGFVFYHLQNPGVFFNLTHYFLLLIHLLCIYIFFLFARRFINTQGATLATSLAVMYFAIHPGTLGASMIWNHNSFSFPFGTLLLLFLFKTLQKEIGPHTGIPIIALIGLGLGAGILASFTIYLLAWLGGILITIFLYYLLKRLPFLQTATALAITGASGVIGFFLATLPVLGKLSFFFNWVFRIFTHESRYLAVPEHEPTFIRIYNNYIKLGNTLPALFIATTITLILVVIVVYVFWRKTSEKAGTWALIGGLTTQTVLLLFILLDRPSRDAYFLSLAAILPVLMLAILSITQHKPKIHQFLAAGTGILVLIGIISTTYNGISTHRKEISSLASAEAKISETINNHASKVNRDPDEIVILWTHDTYSTCWGLRLGNIKAGKVFDAELDILCKNQFQLNNNFRAVMSDQSHRLKEVNWDIIFTCEKWANDLVEYNPTISIEYQPGIEMTCGNMIIAFKNKTP
jgi:hypothetical protein